MTNYTFVKIVIIILLLKCYEKISVTKKKEYGQKYVYLFHRPTCPYCRDIYPAWKKLEQTESNGYKLIKINIEDNNDPNKNLVESYGVTSVPVIYKVTNGIKEKYDGSRTAHAMKKWLFN
jgi:thioredoxin-like negative regulator of GroEL